MRCVLSLLLFAASLPAIDWFAVRPVEVARVATYSEGVVVDSAGILYISHADRISRVTPAGEVSEWAVIDAPNGHKILPDGNHLVCDGKGAVFLLSPRGAVIKAVANPPWGANDITLDPDNGGFYFTSPNLSRSEPQGLVYYVDRDGAAHLVAENMGFPNGLVLPPGGKKLFVGESLYNRIVEFDVLEPGRLGEMRVFASLPSPTKGEPAAKPDGMALDEDGNLYVAHYGMSAVQVLDPRGKLIATLPTGAMYTSNVAFAGDKMDQLYVTGSIGPSQQTAGVLMRLDLSGVRGLHLLPH
jgi:gluconolactonase